MTLKEMAKDFKFWIGIIVVIVTSLTALGAYVDRPVWKSELDPVFQMAGRNAEDIIQMKIDDIQRREWDNKDRYEKRPNKDLKRRILKLEQQRERLEEEKKELLKKK